MPCCAPKCVHIPQCIATTQCYDMYHLNTSLSSPQPPAALPKQLTTHVLHFSLPHFPDQISLYNNYNHKIFLTTIYHTLNTSIHIHKLQQTRKNIDKFVFSHLSLSLQNNTLNSNTTPTTTQQIQHNTI